MRTVIVIGAMMVFPSACGSSTAANGKLQVVAAENVYGDIAAQIGGPHASVTSILTSPTADPHLFEPATSTGLAVSGAKVVLQNGLGYDAFMTKLEDASPSTSRIVVTVADVLGVHGNDANPHLWYDVPRLDRVAGEFRRAQAAYGRDSAGVFGGGGLTNEKAYWLGKFARVALRTA